MRVIVVEDDPMLRATFVTALTHLGVEVAGSAETADHALALVDEHAPDVVTLDLRLAKEPEPADAGLRIAERVRARYPEVALLVLAGSPKVAHAEKLMALEEPPRAVGLMAKDSLGDMELITDAMSRVVKGQIVIDPQLVRQLLSPRPARTTSAADPLARLTPREREILALVATGLSNLAIAQKLSCALSNVERNLTTIFHKLGLVSADAGEQRSLNRRVLATLIYLRAGNQSER
ncbi:response regulator transcription factor [Nonomuraea sp. NPDC050691]|uniref:response regulator transcription factor n=1 Tax=Nonomuraea sp. NPDC050691 TaxID=3155661 RepID=UPI00341144E0